MTLKTEGIWKCVVLGGTYGQNDKGLVEVHINVEFTEGPDKGKRCTYMETVDTRSAKYAAQCMKAVGWKGVKPSTTFAADIAEWIVATGGASTVEIKHIPIKNGKRAGETWDKVNSVGRTGRVLKLAIAGHEMVVDADAALTAAIEAGDFGGFGGGGDDRSVPPQDDIPFVTCEMSSEPSPIARILR